MLLIESSKIERRASKEVAKKSKTRVSFLVVLVLGEVIALRVSNGFSKEGP